jgi:hypothetical protein
MIIVVNLCLLTLWLLPMWFCATWFLESRSKVGTHVGCTLGLTEVLITIIPIVNLGYSFAHVTKSPYLSNPLNSGFSRYYGRFK